MKLMIPPRRLPRLIARVFLLTGVLPACSGSALAADRTPEEVVAAYVAAAQAEGPTSVVRFLHPDELARFRAGVEPGIRAALADRRGRPAFASFADPARPATLRAFASDTDFLLAFITWISRQNTQATQSFKDAEVTALGQVDEGELRHVVLRVRVDSDAPETDRITLISTKPHDGEPMLLLTSDLERLMIPFTMGR